MISNIEKKRKELSNYLEKINDGMLYHSDRELMFAPLLTCLDKNNESNENRKNVLDNYMYMGHHKNKNGYYYYKHTWTRKYTIIDEDGDVLSGILDTRHYSF